MLGPELVQHADDGAPQVVLAILVVRRGDRRDQGVEPALLLAGVEGGERVGQLGVVLEPDPRSQSFGAVGAGRVLEQRQGRRGLAALVEQAGERDGGVRAVGLELERAAQVVLAARGDEAVGLGRARASRNLATWAGGNAPVNSATTLPSRKALTAGMPWMRKALAICWLASVSSLARSTCGSRSRIALSSTGVSWRHGPHHAAQKSTTTGTSWER